MKPQCRVSLKRKHESESEESEEDFSETDSGEFTEGDSDTDSDDDSGCMMSFNTYQQGQESGSEDWPRAELKIPQQTLMEMVVADVDPSDMQQFQHSDGTFRPIAEWKGVSVTDGKVIAIQWEKTFLKEGILNFKWLPPTLKKFHLKDSNIKGRLCLDAFPQDIEEVTITSTKLSGAINFPNLPRKLKILNLSSNRFRGMADTRNLPRSLEKLILSNNRFDGTVHLDDAPKSLKRIELSNNRFGNAHLSTTKVKGRLILLDGNCVDEDRLVKNMWLTRDNIEKIDHSNRWHKRIYDWDNTEPDGVFTIAHLTPYEPGIQWH